MSYTTLFQGKFTIEQAMSDPLWLEWFNACNKQREMVESMEILLEKEKWILGNLFSAEPFIHPHKKRHPLMKTVNPPCDHKSTVGIDGYCGECGLPKPPSA
jgi:hypothetical protein